MSNRFIFSILLSSLFVFTKAQVANTRFTVTWNKSNVSSFTYASRNGKAITIQLPTFEIEGKPVPSLLSSLRQSGRTTGLKNGVMVYTADGAFSQMPALHLQITFEISPDNPVLRFQYHLSTNSKLRLTKATGKDNITYLSFSCPNRTVTEVRFSSFNERFHATHATEQNWAERYFANETAFMGPMAVMENAGTAFLVAYEHGSQYPDRFLEFRLNKEKMVAIHSVKGNYLDNQPANDFTSVWFETAAAKGDENTLAEAYRSFVLKYLSENEASRRPYIFYNTWGRQERVQWTGQKYLSSMNLNWTLKEIDRAHAMGVEVFVLDVGWFNKTGDWEVNKAFFPDSLRQVKAKLDQYGMKLGLWFNPTVAAISSNMYQKNLANRMSWNGQYNEPHEIWETEKSVGLCLVSAYWEDFANKLIQLSKELGVTYFKWDAIGQYGCNDAHHFHGTEKDSPQERSERYAFLQPLYMTRIVDKVVKAIPGAIVDFDITEDGRCVGLQFLSSGKYFIINNGPYYHNFDLAPQWKSVLPSGNVNIFVQPGPARGWFVRSVLDYDKWIPSVLFLTHYQPDEPRNSQIINIGSLILGQNGIWGEILKTSEAGVQLFDSILTRYKQIREDITGAQLIRTGETGDSPEIYEKINPVTGKGCVVIFANSKGTYTYITKNKAVNKVWHNEDVIITRDSAGSDIITTTFKEPSAKIILIGVD